MFDSPWFQSTFAELGQYGSANQPNPVANSLGTIGRYVGVVGLAASVVYSISQIASADDKLQAGLTQALQLSSGLAGGYLAGYAVGEATVVGLGLISAVSLAPVAVASIAAAGTAIATVAGSIYFARVGAQAAAYLYREFQPSSAP